MLRSASRYKALDETGIFGYCCRHEFPHKFVNLKHGERYELFCIYLEMLVNLVSVLYISGDACEFG